MLSLDCNYRCYNGPILNQRTHVILGPNGLGSFKTWLTEALFFSSILAFKKVFLWVVSGPWIGPCMGVTPVLVKYFHHTVAHKRWGDEVIFLPSGVKWKKTVVKVVHFMMKGMPKEVNKAISCRLIRTILCSFSDSHPRDCFANRSWLTWGSI